MPIIVGAGGASLLSPRACGPPCGREGRAGMGGCGVAGSPPPPGMCECATWCSSRTTTLGREDAAGRRRTADGGVVTSNPAPVPTLEGCVHIETSRRANARCRFERVMETLDLRLQPHQLQVCDFSCQGQRSCPGSPSPSRRVELCSIFRGRLILILIGRTSSP